ncbi:hypothetical protein C4B68_21440 [Streptomyces dengpaensis]|uniref:Uncharacterized protein n=1 Tax=Streptomyces dengpaensis TaxID=2049881 RepID=A0ABM6SU34_9ACTN|nr:hypothetical protein C4B68_21440 [Streptomyces dengpaensis]PIB03912.1 hypothetical protein B1C81_35280 [Streptomyces sp. HG99]
MRYRPCHGWAAQLPRLPDHGTPQQGKNIKGSVALVTRANCGIDRASARALIEHGAAKGQASATRQQCCGTGPAVCPYCPVTSPAAAVMSPRGTRGIPLRGAQKW